MKKSDRLGRVEEDASPCSRRIPASDQREVLGVDVLASKRLKSDLTLAQNLSSMLSSSYKSSSAAWLFSLDQSGVVDSCRAGNL